MDELTELQYDWHDVNEPDIIPVFDDEKDDHNDQFPDDQQDWLNFITESFTER